jgi:hypothetical protein
MNAIHFYNEIANKYKKFYKINLKLKDIAVHHTHYNLLYKLMYIQSG